MPEINEFGQQVNDRVPGWQGAGLLRRTALNGRFCRLEPLDTERHAADLFAAYALGDDSDWTWLASNCPQSVESTAHWITGKVMDDGLVPYAVIDLHAERAVGLVSYMAIERAMGTVEIGHVTATAICCPSSTASGLRAMRRCGRGWRRRTLMLVDGK